MRKQYLILLTLIALLGTGYSLARGTYQSPEDFLADTFSGTSPEPGVIWLTGERKTFTENLLGHRYNSLRVRYWQQERTSAWILEEVGKDLPITFGVVVNNGRLERIKVLIFRESRGWEIRHPFFTDQFKNAGLTSEGRLDQNIDGISGATLSVRAMKKIATLALYLDSQLNAADVSPSP